MKARRDARRRGRGGRADVETDAEADAPSRDLGEPAEAPDGFGNDAPTTLPKVADAGVAPGVSLHRHRVQWSKPSSTAERMALSKSRSDGALRRRKPFKKSSLAGGVKGARGEVESWYKG